MHYPRSSHDGGHELLQYGEKNRALQLNIAKAGTHGHHIQLRPLPLLLTLVRSG